MIIKKNEYIHAKSTDIIDQIVPPALAAKRKQFLTLERQRLLAGVSAKIFLSPHLNPQNSYVTEHALSEAQYKAPELDNTEARMRLRANCGLSIATQAKLKAPLRKRGKPEPCHSLTYEPMIKAGLTPTENTNHMTKNVFDTEDQVLWPLW